MKKKKKFKQQDEFGISDYELYSYAVSRYKEATGDKSLSITGIIVYLEKEIRYYRKKIVSYDKLFKSKKSMADPTKYEITCLECRHFENCVDAKRKEGEEFYCYTYEPRCRYLVKPKKYKAGEGPELKFKFLDREDVKP
jgi:hypothetical protein